jgi:hypothetical protein
MICPKCKGDLEGFWCDDDIHQPGMLYTCNKCSAEFWEEDGQELHEIKKEKMIWKNYRKKPIVIQAREITEDEIKVKTKEGIMLGRKGDFLIKGIEGELYPCARDIFFKTYDEV